MRRFHPYARYQRPAEQHSEENRDELEPLDLSILNVRMPQIAMVPVALLNEVDNYNEQENAVEVLRDDNDHEVDNRNGQESEVEELSEDSDDEEPPLLVDPDMIYANFEEEESRQSTFLRIDVTSALEALRFE
jgi:hypothetical protein